MSPSGPDLGLLALAAVAGGTVNALAGGGTLITFPALTALGVPPLNANITNTVALVPGYFGGTLAQRRDLRDQQRRVAVTVLPAVAGGIIGGALLLQTGTTLFRTLVPWLILLATGLLAAEPWLKRTVLRRLQAPAGASRRTWPASASRRSPARSTVVTLAPGSASSCWRSSRSCCPTH